MVIYLVEDVGNSPGKIYACFARKTDAERFASAITGAMNTEAEVVQRTLFHGQPPVLGTNP
ncbi:hypothetical protein D3C80_1441990 [compost metagenome]